MFNSLQVASAQWDHLSYSGHALLAGSSNDSTIDHHMLACKGCALQRQAGIIVLPADYLWYTVEMLLKIDPDAQDHSNSMTFLRMWCIHISTGISTIDGAGWISA